jgi:hypothetical protein
MQKRIAPASEAPDNINSITRLFNVNITVVFFISSLFISFCASSQQGVWRGLVVQPENRCSPYDKKSQYPYSQSVEDTIVELMGGLVYGPYSGLYFNSDKKTDIEHIVATSEAHDSGLCSASKEVRKQFASDQLNLTLASPKVNRCSSTGKCGLDAGEWMPERNKCWFSKRVVDIKTKYNLSVDLSEARAIESIVSQCDSFEMVFFAPSAGHIISQAEPDVITYSNDTDNALDMYDDNKNGRITCSEARSHGINPVTSVHPAYEFMKDGNKDGVICE